MKTKTILSSLGLASLLLTANLASAQFKSHGGGSSSSSSSSGSGDNAFTIAGDVGYNSFFQSVGGAMSIGVNGEYDMEKFSYRFNFNYWFPISSTSDAGDAYDPTNPINMVDVTATDKITVMDLGLDVKKTFGSAGPAQGGFYLFAGIGLVLASESLTYSSYPANYVGPSGSSTGSYDQLYIRLGLGYDYKLSDKGLIFGEFGLPLAANSANGVYVGVAIPSYYYLHAGYRIVFGR